MENSQGMQKNCASNLKMSALCSSDVIVNPLIPVAELAQSYEN